MTRAVGALARLQVRLAQAIVTAVRWVAAERIDGTIRADAAVVEATDEIVDAHRVFPAEAGGIAGLACAAGSTRAATTVVAADLVRTLWHTLRDADGDLSAVDATTSLVVGHADPVVGAGVRRLAERLRSAIGADAILVQLTHAVIGAVHDDLAEAIGVACLTLGTRPALASTPIVSAEFTVAGGDTHRSASGDRGAIRTLAAFTERIAQPVIEAVV